MPKPPAKGPALRGGWGGRIERTRGGSGRGCRSSPDGVCVAQTWRRYGHAFRNTTSPFGHDAARSTRGVPAAYIRPLPATPSVLSTHAGRCLWPSRGVPVHCSSRGVPVQCASPVLSGAVHAAVWWLRAAGPVVPFAEELGMVAGRGVVRAGHAGGPRRGVGAGQK